jgi:hypothetical protein
MADRWVFLAPALLELVEHRFGLFYSRWVDAPKVISDFLSTLQGDVIQALPDHMDNTELAVIIDGER